MNGAVWFVFGALVAWFACAHVHRVMFRAIERVNENAIESARAVLAAAEQYAATFERVTDLTHNQGEVERTLKVQTDALEALDTTVGNMLNALTKAGLFQTAPMARRNTAQRGEPTREEFAPPLDPEGARLSPSDAIPR